MVPFSIILKRRLSAPFAPSVDMQKNWKILQPNQNMIFHGDFKRFYVVVG
jgi:hypothetical protein